MKKDVILIDCDQCLLNFNQRVADIYEELFQHKPAVKNPHAFKASNMYDFSNLNKQEMEIFGSHCTGENMWSKMKPMDGALDFVNSLSHDFSFIVFTSMQPVYEKVRMQNLLDVGFNVDRVFAVPGSKTHNPKEDFARETHAAFFIDDLAKNFKGIHDIPTKLILLDHQYTDGANDNREGIHIHHTVHSFTDLKSQIIQPYLDTKYQQEEPTINTSKKFKI